MPYLDTILTFITKFGGVKPDSLLSTKLSHYYVVQETA